MTSYAKDYPLASDMTLRDYFAAQAITAVNAMLIACGLTRDADLFAQLCYGLADAMLKAREEKKP